MYRYVLILLLTSGAFIPRVPEGSLSLNFTHLPSTVAFSTRSKSDSIAVTLPLPGHEHSIPEEQRQSSFKRMFEPIICNVHIE